MAKVRRQDLLPASLSRYFNALCAVPECPHQNVSQAKRTDAYSDVRDQRHGVTDTEDTPFDMYQQVVKEGDLHIQTLIWQTRNGYGIRKFGYLLLSYAFLMQFLGENANYGSCRGFAA